MALSLTKFVVTRLSRQFLTIIQISLLTNLNHNGYPGQRLRYGIVGLQDKGRPTFGVDLAEQMARDNVEVPLVVVKCCQAIEKYGIRSQGIYRVSGMSSKVTNLKQRLDKGAFFMTRWFIFGT